MADTKEIKKSDHPVDNKTSTPTHEPMDPKKKKILIGAGAFGVIVLVYLWYRNNNSSSGSTSTTPSGSGITSYVAPSGGSGGGTPSIANTNTFNPVNTFTNTPTNTNSYTAGGTSTSPSYPQLPAKKGGKTQIHHTIVKHGVKRSGGTGKVSMTTATQRTINQRAANQRRTANIRAANQRKIANRQHAAMNKHFNHVAPPSHSFTRATPISPAKRVVHTTPRSLFGWSPVSTPTNHISSPKRSVITSPHTINEQHAINQRAANQRRTSNIRAANQRKIHNVRAANQRKIANRQTAAIHNHISSPQRSVVAAPHNTASHFVQPLQHISPPRRFIRPPMRGHR